VGSTTASVDSAERSVGFAHRHRSSAPHRPIASAQPTADARTVSDPPTYVPPLDPESYSRGIAARARRVRARRSTDAHRRSSITSTPATFPNRRTNNLRGRRLGGDRAPRRVRCSAAGDDLQSRGGAGEGENT
jgi:hypothetical protein